MYTYLAFVDRAVPKASLIGRLIQNHGVFHVIALMGYENFRLGID